MYSHNSGWTVRDILFDLLFYAHVWVCVWVSMVWDTRSQWKEELGARELVVDTESLMCKSYVTSLNKCVFAPYSLAESVKGGASWETQ